MQSSTTTTTARITTREMRAAQEFRQRVIASELENIPTGLLQLLETAENIAAGLVKTQNKILENQHLSSLPPQADPPENPREEVKSSARESKRRSRN